MPTILNIETSSKNCSVAISQDGVAVYQLEDTEGMNHAVRLAPFVEKCMEQLRRREEKLDAVAVSIGPGSYTGLRIGLSLAKGLCFGLDIPLIGIPTLKILAVKAMFGSYPFTGEELLAPMTDARRMEVYTAAYDFALNEVSPAAPMILTEDSYADLLESHKVCFMGDGSEKARSVITSPNAIWLGPLEPFARNMIALSEKALRERDFIDPAYSVPLYLKEYEAKKSSPKF